MSKQDPRSLYVLTLECGHQRPGPMGATTKRCRECHRMMRVTDSGDLLRGALPDNSPQTRVRSRSDGLMVRHFNGQPRKIWWCRICYGKHPHDAYRTIVYSIDDVFAGWDRHKVSEAHVERSATADRIATLFSER